MTKVKNEVQQNSRFLKPWLSFPNHKFNNAYVEYLEM